MFQLTTDPDPKQIALWLLAAFLSGSVPFGLLVVKLLGKGDVRAQGSGNIGATNVSRVAGKGVGILVLLLDAAKGFLPVFLLKRAGAEVPLLAWAAAAAVGGHMFTPWLRFKGGKGVATALGVALAFHAPMVLLPFLLFVVVVGVTRYVSLGSILAAAAIAVPAWLAWASARTPAQPGAITDVHLRWAGQLLSSRQILIAALAWSLISLLVILKHRENIRRLAAGTESKLWGGKKQDSAHA